MAGNTANLDSLCGAAGGQGIHKLIHSGLRESLACECAKKHAKDNHPSDGPRAPPLHHQYIVPHSQNLAHVALLSSLFSLEAWTLQSSRSDSDLSAVAGCRSPAVRKARLGHARADHWHLSAVNVDRWDLATPRGPAQCRLLGQLSRRPAATVTRPDDFPDRARPGPAQRWQAAIREGGGGRFSWTAAVPLDIPGGMYSMILSTSLRCTGSRGDAARCSWPVFRWADERNGGPVRIDTKGLFHGICCAFKVRRVRSASRDGSNLRICAQRPHTRCAHTVVMSPQTKNPASCNSQPT